MQVHIFDNLEKLNDFLKDRRMRNTNIIYKSWVVDQKEIRLGQKEFELVDRWCVITK